MMAQKLTILIVGILIGSAIIFALYNWGEQPAIPTESEIILDEIIDAWTSPTDSLFTTQAYFFKLKESRLGFIPDTVRVLAMHIESTYKIPKGVVIAQWILESKWGLCDLGANNYFGHTYAATRQYLEQPQYVAKQDKKFVNGVAIPVIVRFASYRDIAECFEIHGKYLQGSLLYQSAFKTNSPEKFARSISKHYAEDPDYAIKLIALMRRYKLE
jgi:flagellum-specific peptidoglycan hydrolase FlgJ